MAEFVFTQDKPGFSNTLLVSEDLIEASDAEINSALPMAQPGYIIHTAGYGAMKQMDLDRSWKTM